MATSKRKPAQKIQPVSDPDFMEIDLIGGPPSTSEERAPTIEEAKAKGETFDQDISTIFSGVSGHWLATVFGMDPLTVKKKLGKAGVGVIGKRKGGNLYALKEAAQYLIKPRVDLQEYIKGLRPNDLPPMLNDAYWRAMIQRQKWEENAGELWRTDDVLAVFGELAMSIKSQVTLWVEELDRVHGLTPEMRTQVTQMSDNLLQQIHEIMVESPSKKRTVSSIYEEGVMPDAGPKPTEDD